MKPAFAQFVKTVIIRDSNDVDFGEIEFDIKTEKRELKKFFIKTDCNFENLLSSAWKDKETEENEQVWVNSLFAFWKNLRGNTNSGEEELKKDLFFLTTQINENLVWKISKDMAARIFTEKEDHIQSFITNSYQNIIGCASNFFKLDEDVPLYKFQNRSNSTLQSDQIDRIENHINQLEKEMKSFWYPNKDRKALKVAELKSLLERSTLVDAHAAISVSLKNNEACAGLSSRTFDLLCLLQKEAWSKQYSNISSTCL